MYVILDFLFVSPLVLVFPCVLPLSSVWMWRNMKTCACPSAVLMTGSTGSTRWKVWKSWVPLRFRECCSSATEWQFSYCLIFYLSCVCVRISTISSRPSSSSTLRLHVTLHARVTRYLNIPTMFHFLRLRPSVL